MNRIIPQADMPAAQLMQCSSDVTALLNLCHLAAWEIQNSSDKEEIAELADNIVQVTRLAAELLEPVTEALATHEGLRKGK
ncbi:hypothetical protein [Mesorhizobium marinum]|uniref:hypothetical protein n=1 Tax=Mesorhizobium marinum TaxID=3228790 RepID=UPI003467CAD6